MQEFYRQICILLVFIKKWSMFITTASKPFTEDLVRRVRLHLQPCACRLWQISPKGMRLSAKQCWNPIVLIRQEEDLLCLYAFEKAECTYRFGKSWEVLWSEKVYFYWRIKTCIRFVFTFWISGFYCFQLARYSWMLDPKVSGKQGFCLFHCLLWGGVLGCLWSL